MSKTKAGKLLAKALDNGSKEEASTAFGMAFSYAERAGIRLSSIHRVEIIETAADIAPDRERELVDKYNAALKRAKELRGQLEEVKAESARRLAGWEESNALNDRFRETMDRAEAQLIEANESAAYFENQLEHARERLNAADAAKVFAQTQAATLQEAFDREQEKRLQAQESGIDFAVKVHELEEQFLERANRCKYLADDNARLRELNEAREKENRELKRQLTDAKRTSENNVTEAQDLIDALKEVITARETISEQAHEIAALRSDRDALQARIDGWNSNSFMRIFGR